MAGPCGVTAPLVLRYPGGGSKVIAACFPHPAGLLYLDISWYPSTPDRAAHLVRGELTGGGPWMIGGCLQKAPGSTEASAWSK